HSTQPEDANPSHRPHGTIDHHNFASSLAIAVLLFLYLQPPVVLLIIDIDKMKLSICTIVSAAAANAQLQSVPGRLRSATTTNEWGRQRRTQITRSLESSMSFSMDFDASISMPEVDDLSVGTSMSMVGDMEWAIPDEPEMVLDEVAVVDEESETEVDGDETAEESAETSEEDFVDGEFVDMKLEANTASSYVVSSAAAITAFAIVNML
ncbi:hypothetical protein ACHAXN_013127, partial [Cyclotella atomus]